MPHILITGANGFVGATMIDESLKAGHTVTGCVRSMKSGTDLVAIHPEWDASKIDWVDVADYTAKDVFDKIFQEGDYDYVLHIAAPMPDNPTHTDFETHFEKPSVEGHVVPGRQELNLNLLRSANKYGKNVKAIAVIGSINAVTTGDVEDRKSRVMSNTEWIPLTRNDAIKMQNAFISYCISKKVGEQAIWDFVAKEKPSFTVTNFMPPLIMGPPLQKVRDLAKINFSVNFIYHCFDGTTDTVSTTMFPAYIDVRDLADLLIASLTTKAAANKRFVVGHQFKFQDIADSLKKMPELQGRMAKDNNETIVPIRLDTKPAEEALPIKYRTADQTFQETAEYLLKLEAERKL